MLDEDLDLKAKITDVLECAVKEVIALVEADRDVEKNSAELLPEWMTAAQLARYWQLVNANREPIRRDNEVGQAARESTSTASRLHG